MKSLKDFEFTPCEYSLDTTDRIEYRGCLILPECPNGGLTILSIQISGDWWSIPTNMHKHCSSYPDFDYHESDKAISWAKTLIDRILDQKLNHELGES